MVMLTKFTGRSPLDEGYVEVSCVKEKSLHIICMMCGEGNFIDAGCLIPNPYTPDPDPPPQRPPTLASYH